MNDAAAAGRLGFGMGLVDRFLASRTAPLVFGCMTLAENWFVRGSLSRAPIVHDETAYLFQAKVFSSGRWVADPPPLPEFFEQFQVLVTPVFAGKYPPGHSLVLVPGIWLGAPGLLPLLLAGIAGGLVFLLARRHSNGWVALMTWLIWSTSPGALRFLTSYLSQNTSLVLCLLGWWSLGNWLRKKNTGWLALSLALGAFAILTRPFTAVALAAPAVFVVAREILRRGNWREVAVAVVPAGLILALLPIWSAKTTGDPLTTPYTLYSKIYFPYQRPGFGLPDEIASQRKLPPEMELYAEQHRKMHSGYTLRTVPGQLLERLGAIGFDSWGEARVVLLWCALVGLLVLPREGWFAVATAVFLVVVHVPLAHAPTWSIYYVEAEPVLAFIAALGVWTLIGVVGARGRLERFRPRVATSSTGTALVVVLLVVLAFGPLLSRVVRVRELWFIGTLPREYFERVVASIPEPRAVVFVRDRPNHDPNSSLISNEPDLRKAKAWIVRDRGPDNVRLLQVARDRVPYLYDEATHSLVRWRS